MSVPAYWYRRSDLRPWLLRTSAGRSQVRNFGDEFCGDFLTWWTGEEPERSLLGKRRVVVGGSILHLLRKGDAALSVGARAPGGRVPRGLRVFGARGPLTAAELKKGGYDIPKAGLFLCDVGLFAPEVYGAPGPIHEEVLLVPHFRHEEMWRAVAPECFPAAPLLSPRMEPHEIADRIGESARIVTSSLHGLIFAAAFGREVTWVAPPRSEPQFKFHDFYQAFSLVDVAPVDELSDAVRGHRTPLPSLNEIESRKSELPAWIDVASTMRRR